jgi:hypothetical protein
VTFRQRLAHFATQNSTATMVLVVVSAVIGMRGLVSLIWGIDDGASGIVAVSALNLLLGAGGVWVLLRARHDGRRSGGG